jgi:hypothetical protein
VHLCQEINGKHVLKDISKDIYSTMHMKVKEKKKDVHLSIEDLRFKNDDNSHKVPSDLHV